MPGATDPTDARVTGTTAETEPVTETESAETTTVKTKPTVVEPTEEKPTITTTSEANPTIATATEVKFPVTTTAEATAIATTTTATTVKLQPKTTTTVTTTTPTTAPPTPPPGFSECGGIYLSLQTTAVSYSRAESKCARLEAHLAVPRTPQQNQCALQLAGGTNAWIGVSDRVTEGVFETADGKGPLDQPFWDWYSPNNYRGDQHCAELYFDYSRRYPEPGWNDERCDKDRNAMCQWSP